MKKLITILAGSVLLMSIFASTTFAAEQSFSLSIYSTPLASNGYTDYSGGVLNTSIGQTVSFTRVVASQGVTNISWEWNFDKNYLDCAAYPEFDSDTLKCEVLAEGSTGVNIRMSPVMADGNTWGHTSNTIQLKISGQLPPKISYNNLEPLYDFSLYNSPFPDLLLTSLVGRAAAELWRRDIISGYLDGEFKAYNRVNRAEATKFLVNAKFGGPNSNNGKTFSDVPNDAWYKAYVTSATSAGIMTGYPDGTFGPGNEINTAEFMKMITLTFNLPLNLSHKYTDVPANIWYSAYAGAAQEYELFPLRSSTKLEPGKIMTREEIAIAIYSYHLKANSRSQIPY